MGIKNFKYLFNNIKCNNPPSTFKTLIADGNNLIMNSLCSAKSKIEKQYPLVEWQGFAIDIVQQTKLILLEAYKMILTELNNFQKNYDIKEIWIVFDPTKDMHYDINVNTFDLIDPEFFISQQQSDNIITLHLKEEEHRKREQSRTFSKDKMKNTINSITNSDYYKQLADTNLLTAIYQQSYGYNDITLLHKLQRMLQKALIAKSRFNLHLNFIDEREDYINLNTNIDINSKIYTVRSRSEADLIIKNIANNLTIISPQENILIMSKDTDYKVLFADSPNVYIASLHYDYNNSLFHPYSAWRLIIPTANNIYEYAIRFAPIFGNDYTCGKGIITLTENTDSISLVKSLLTLDPTGINKRSTLYKVITSANKTTDILSPTDLDTIIKAFDLTYYSKYLQSVIIYTNFIQYQQFEISTKYFDFDENLDFVYNNIIKPAFQILYYFKPTSDVKQLFTNNPTLIEDFKQEFYKQPKPINDIDDSYFD